MPKFYTVPNPITCECGAYVFVYARKDEDYMVVECTNPKCEGFEKKRKVKLVEVLTEAIDG